MRKLIPFILISVFSISGVSLANDIDLRKHTAEEIKSVCDKVGGAFSQDAAGYGCGTNCHGGPGTDCVVACKNGQTCYGQVIGGRRPTSVLNALRTPARAAR